MPSPYGVVVAIVSIATALVILAPIIIMFVRTLLPGGELNTQAFADAFSRPGLGAAVVNSLIIVVVVNLTAVPVGTLFAWLNFRTNARLGPMASLLPVLPLLLAVGGGDDRVGVPRLRRVRLPHHRDQEPARC